MCSHIKRRKDKSHPSRQMQKEAFDKIQHPLMINPNKLSIEGTYQHNKNHIGKSIFHPQW